MENINNNRSISDGNFKSTDQSIHSNADKSIYLSQNNNYNSSSNGNNNNSN